MIAAPSPLRTHAPAAAAGSPRSAGGAPSLALFADLLATGEAAGMMAAGERQPAAENGKTLPEGMLPADALPADALPTSTLPTDASPGGVQPEVAATHERPPGATLPIEAAPAPPAWLAIPVPPIAASSPLAAFIPQTAVPRTPLAPQASPSDPSATAPVGAKSHVAPRPSRARADAASAPAADSPIGRGPDAGERPPALATSASDVSPEPRPGAAADLPLAAVPSTVLPIGPWPGAAAQIPAAVTLPADLPTGTGPGRNGRLSVAASDIPIGQRPGMPADLPGPAPAAPTSISQSPTSLAPTSLAPTSAALERQNAAVEAPPSAPLSATADLAPPVFAGPAAGLIALARDPALATVHGPIEIDPGGPAPTPALPDQRTPAAPVAKTSVASTAVAEIGVAPTALPILAPGASAPAGRIFAAALHAAAQDGRTDRDLPLRDNAIMPGVVAAADLAPHAVTRAADLAGAGGGTLDLRDGRWPHAMMDRIERLRDDANAADTRIRLVPDRLGQVDVAVRREGDTLHVSFHAAEAETRALLADAQPRLAEIAQGRGLRLGDAQVSGGPGQGDRQPPRPAPASVTPAPVSRPAAASAEADLSTDTRIA